MIIYIIGDSISAGIGNNIKLYSEIINESGKLYIVNLSVSGTELHHGLEQYKKIDFATCPIIVELGGNDVLENKNYETYRKDLYKLLRTIDNGKCKIVMFELPLPFFKKGYIKIQRELSKNSMLL